MSLSRMKENVIPPLRRLREALGLRRDDCEAIGEAIARAKRDQIRRRTKLRRNGCRGFGRDSGTPGGFTGTGDSLTVTDRRDGSRRTFFDAFGELDELAEEIACRG